MNQLFQDSMAICQAFHKSNIFLTMTANPNWPEIKEQLFLIKSTFNPANNSQRQETKNRPDLVACVFEQKKKSLLKDVKDGLFGKTVAMDHTIEFQK